MTGRPWRFASAQPPTHPVPPPLPASRPRETGAPWLGTGCTPALPAMYCPRLQKECAPGSRSGGVVVEKVGVSVSWASIYQYNRNGAFVSAQKQ